MVLQHARLTVSTYTLPIGITLGITTFIGLIVRYAVQEFDPTVSTITVTTSRVDNKDIASLSVSKNFLEKILEFVEESIAIVATIIPLGFPLCTLVNRSFAKIRAGSDRVEIKSNEVLNIIPKYIVIGDTQACQMPNSDRLRPLVRDTIYHLIKAHLKPKLIVEDSYEAARGLGIRIGLIRREHHKFAVIKSVDLLKNITDSRGDIKQGRVRYLLSKMKIMSQSTPADKSLLIYLMKHCEPMPNENLVYLGYSFTDPEAMRIADCAMTFQDCDDEDVRKSAQVVLKSENMSFTDVYLFMVVCIILSNITQSYALYQISAAVSCCLYRFLSITVFREQLISHSQFTLIATIHQVFAVFALMTKWLSSLPQAPLRNSIAEMSHAATEDSFAARSPYKTSHSRRTSHQPQSETSSSGSGNLGETTGDMALHVPTDSLHPNQIADDTHNATSIQLDRLDVKHFGDDTLGSSTLDTSTEASDDDDNSLAYDTTGHHRPAPATTSRSRSRSDLSQSQSGEGLGLRKSSVSASRHRRRRRHKVGDSSQHIQLSGADLDEAIINSKLATTYKQTFNNTSIIDDVTYRLAKLHIAYQLLVMIIIMIFGNTMFQLNANDNRQHQTLAFNSLVMNNIFNLANCFNQFGEFDLKSGFRNHPFFVCVLLLSVVFQVSLTELNAFGLENLNPLQWFVCFVFALLSALIAPLTGQQRRHKLDNPVAQVKQQPQQLHPVAHRYDYESPTKAHHRHHKQQQRHHSRKPSSTSQITKSLHQSPAVKSPHRSRTSNQGS